MANNEETATATAPVNDDNDTNLRFINTNTDGITTANTSTSNRTNTNTSNHASNNNKLQAELKHLNKRIRNLQESIQLSSLTTALSNPQIWQENCLFAVKNCVYEWRHIVSFYLPPIDGDIDDIDDNDDNDDIDDNGDIDVDDVNVDDVNIDIQYEVENANRNVENQQEVVLNQGRNDSYDHNDHNDSNTINEIEKQLEHLAQSSTANTTIPNNDNMNDNGNMNDNDNDNEELCTNSNSNSNSNNIKNDHQKIITNTATKVFGLIQMAMQIGPLKGSNPGYFKRCGVEVARMAQSFLKECVNMNVNVNVNANVNVNTNDNDNNSIMDEMRFTEHQRDVIKKWISNANKAVLANAPPSKSALKLQGKSHSKKSQKKMKRKKKQGNNNNKN